MNGHLYYPPIDPVALQLGPLQLHWYGLMYLLAFCSAWWLARRRILGAERPPFTVVELDNLVFWVILGVIGGGRIGYALFYGWTQLLENPLWLFQIWRGGMSFHGGLLGVLLVCLLQARRLSRSPAVLLDFAAPLVPIGLGLGRLGNFINQELWGRVSDVPWALIYARDPSALPRHPSQLYEALLEGVVLFILLRQYAAKPRRDYAVAGMFVLAYGLMRFAIEFVREPDAPLLMGWLTRGQLLCLPMILIGAVAVLRDQFPPPGGIAVARSSKQ